MPSNVQGIARDMLMESVLTFTSKPPKMQNTEYKQGNLPIFPKVAGDYNFLDKFDNVTPTLVRLQRLIDAIPNKPPIVFRYEKSGILVNDERNVWSGMLGAYEVDNDVLGTPPTSYYTSPLAFMRTMLHELVHGTIRNDELGPRFVVIPFLPDPISEAVTRSVEETVAEVTAYLTALDAHAARKSESEDYVKLYFGKLVHEVPFLAPDLIATLPEKIEEIYTLMKGAN